MYSWQKLSSSPMLCNCASRLFASFIKQCLRDSHSVNPFLPETRKGSNANSADPDQMPHNVASDQGLHGLLTGFSIKNRIKATK